MTFPMRTLTVAMILPSLALALCASLSCMSVTPRTHEVRAVWMSRYDYAEGKTPAQSRGYITAELERCRKAGINTVIFQVRGQADALYRSTLEPWSDLLTGELGKRPGLGPARIRDRCGAPARHGTARVDQRVPGMESRCADSAGRQSPSTRSWRTPNGSCGTAAAFR